MVAFRYLGHVSSNFLSTIFLDRQIHQMKSYLNLFNKGVGLCMLTWNPQTREYIPVPWNHEASGAVSEARTSTSEPFKAFDGCKYPAKSRPTEFEDELRFRGVNSWVENLAESQEEPSVGASQSEPVPAPGPSSEPTGERVHGAITPRSPINEKEDTIDVNSRAYTPSSVSRQYSVEEPGRDPSDHAHSLLMEQGHKQSGASENSGILRTRTLSPIPVDSEAEILESQSSITQPSEVGNTISLHVNTIDNQTTPTPETPHTDTATIAEIEPQVKSGTAYTPNSSNLVAALENSEGETRFGSEDPFLSLYQKAKPPLMTKTSARADSPANDTTLENQASVTIPTRRTESVEDLILMVAEKEDRKFHNTMHQKAGSRFIGPRYHSTLVPDSGNTMNNTRFYTTRAPESISPFGNLSIQRNPGSELVPGLIQSLVDTLKPLRAYPGRLTLTAQLGRFCFMGVNKSYVLSGPEGGSQHWEPAAMKRELDSKHLAPSALWFTPMLTTDGFDANLIANIKEPDGKNMWTPHSRFTIYSFPCVANLNSGQLFMFWVDIDAKDFKYHVRLEDHKPTRFPVHCLKRYWDFQVTVSAAQNVEDICENFAKDLATSLVVT